MHGNARGRQTAAPLSRCTEQSMTDNDQVPATGPGAAPPDGTEKPAGEPLQAALAQAVATAQENWNKYLRAVAELDNVRKRAARDVEQARRFGVERLAAELLPVLDSLEMGLEAGAGASAETLIEGKQATLRLLRGALEKFGVETVAPAGQLFDPQLHEAISIQAVAGTDPGAVLAVVQKGYQLNGRLLRPARVVVSGSPAPQQPDESSAAGGAA
jgi:molecular chaperone GrpE